MRPSGKSKVGNSVGSTNAPYPTERSGNQADASFETQTDYSQSPSVSFTYDGIRLGAAEREAYENWSEPNRPTWKDLILSARVDTIDDSAWLQDLEGNSPSTFSYEGIPLGVGERRVYESWEEDAQPVWEDLVVGARMAELGHPNQETAEYDFVTGSRETSPTLSKRKRSKLIDYEDTSGSFQFEGMKLGEEERWAYDNWDEAEPPTWRDLVLAARIASIADSAWLVDPQTSSSAFEYNGVPLREPERRSLRQWQGDAQPTWEDLVVNARMAELGDAGWIEGQEGRIEDRVEALPNASKRSLESPLVKGPVLSDPFFYDGRTLGAPERIAYERWSKTERPTWEDLILDAHPARIEGDSVSTQSINQSSSPVFLYEGKKLGERERQAYEKWRQPAQPRWQNLVVNARLAELDPSVWIADEHDLLDDGDALRPSLQITLAGKSHLPLDNQSVSRRPNPVRTAVQESSHIDTLTCPLSETLPAPVTPSGPDANQTEIFDDSVHIDGRGDVKRLGCKSDKTATASADDVNSDTKRLLSSEGGLGSPPPSPAKVVRSRSDNIGTYGSRKNERVRLATDTGRYESEHIFGFKVVHSTARATKEGRRLERPMPAYLEYKPLHRQHVGTGKGRTKLVGRGWPDDTSYRSDQRATLSDPVARVDGAIASNGYQLNQLGYAHQLANDGLQSESPDCVALPIQVATTSYNYTVSRDPALTPPGNEEAPQLLHLGPRGQTEAVLARETALTGKWPTREREQQVYREFLALYDVKKDLDAKPVGMRRKKRGYFRVKPDRVLDRHVAFESSIRNRD